MSAYLEELPYGSSLPEGLKSLDLVRRSLVYTTEATIDDDPIFGGSIYGSESEKCFVSFALSTGDKRAYHLSAERDREGTTIVCEKYTAKRKRFTRASWVDEGAKVCVFSKGASELNLERCTQMIGADGIVK